MSNPILCFICDDFADFEITLANHFLHAVGGREVLSVGYDLSPVTAQSGLAYHEGAVVRRNEVEIA